MLEEILSKIFILLVVAGIGAVGSFFTVMYRCVRNQGKRSWRQSQALILMAEIHDELTKSLHPATQNIPPMKPKIVRILQDEKGHL